MTLSFRSGISPFVAQSYLPSAVALLRRTGTLRASGQIVTVCNESPARGSVTRSTLRILAWFRRLLRVTDPRSGGSVRCAHHGPRTGATAGINPRFPASTSRRRCRRANAWLHGPCQINTSWSFDPPSQGRHEPLSFDSVGVRAHGHTVIGADHSPAGENGGSSVAEITGSTAVLGLNLLRSSEPICGFVEHPLSVMCGKGRPRPPRSRATSGRRPSHPGRSASPVRNCPAPGPAHPPFPVPDR